MVVLVLVLMLLGCSGVTDSGVSIATYESNWESGSYYDAASGDGDNGGTSTTIVPIGGTVPPGDGELEMIACTSNIVCPTYYEVEGSFAPDDPERCCSSTKHCGFTRLGVCEEQELPADAAGDGSCDDLNLCCETMMEVAARAPCIAVVDEGSECAVHIPTYCPKGLPIPEGNVNKDGGDGDGDGPGLGSCPVSRGLTCGEMNGYYLCGSDTGKGHYPPACVAGSCPAVLGGGACHVLSAGPDSLCVVTCTP